MTESQLKLGANVFCVTPLPAMRTFALQARIAPAIAALGSIVSIKSIGDLDIDKLGGVVGQLFATLNSAELEAITRTLLAEATVDGVQLFGPGEPFNRVMMGRTVDTWKLLWHALKVNYPDFFDALGGFAGLLPAQMASSSAGSNTSPGPAGASL